MVLYVPSCVGNQDGCDIDISRKSIKNKASRRNTPLHRKDRTGERKLTYQVDVDDGLECVLGETAYGRQAAIKESWFNKPISDSTGSAVGGAYKLPAAPITASREHHYEYHDELCDKRDRTKDPRNRTSSEKGE
jgi:hypothetical protein